MRCAIYRCAARPPNAISNSNEYNFKWHNSQCGGVKWVRVRGAYEVRREEGCGASAEVQGALNELARLKQMPPLHGGMAVVGAEGARAWPV